MIELKTSLLPYQRQAVEKLMPIKVGALYMEMGTGKTRTALEMIKRRHDAGKIDRVLWLCPVSVMVNLYRDLKKHADGFEKIIKIRGIESLSSSIALYAQLEDYVCAGKTMLVVDESSLIKNPKAIRSRRIMALGKLCIYRIILNGTPVSRNEADLFAQWYLLDWRILGYQSYWSFANNHLEFDEKFKHKIRRVLNMDYLTDKIAPYSFMVKKEDCLPLPMKRARIAYYSMTEEQEAHYDQQKDKFLAMLLRIGDDLGESAIYRTFTALQEISSGRRIVTEPEDRIRHEPMFENPEDNPRIQCLLSQIEELDGKIIIWIKFTHELLDIAQVLASRYGTDAVALFYGELGRKKRQMELDKFRDSARFLIANKSCAGYGLNLQFCNQAIYYNNDWDWATRAQSEDRMHRMGQEKDVILIDVCSWSSIDGRILDCLSRKENMADSFRRELKNRNAAKWLRFGDLEERR